VDTREAGRLGGLKKSERKAAACRENGKRPKRKRAAAEPENKPAARPVLVVNRG
jgi:hypothetical protein